ncbi:MAG TPA: glycosyltransferase family 4 protein [Pyrinomonadaceae bacterium]|nr:glycosyltransferase family 4 protein [Pyrinomonadaceae bacterium]
MARISILTPTLVASDAVGNDVLGMHRLLTRRGHDVQLFAEDWNVDGLGVRYAAHARAYAESADDILIYHHSIGWELGADILESSACRTIIKYHNVTPAEFFDGFSKQLRELCELGRAQLASIARAHHTLYLAASAYNMSELLAAGSDRSKTFVVPPFNQAENLAAVAPDMSVLDRYSDGKTNLLMVGSVRPNKGHTSLIEAFAQYYYDFNCHSRLLIVGAEDDKLDGYSKALRELVDLLHLDGAIVFTGEVPADALKAYYLASDVFVITSEHEGFCVPLVEAMSMKLPIVGYASPAIAETIADCGILWDKVDPSLVAESINTLVRDDSETAALAHEGRRRFETMFSDAAIESEFLRATAAAGLEL